MQKLNCIIIDDEPSAHEVLKEYCHHHLALNLMACFLNVQDALNFLDKTKVELIFLDIHMPERTGFDFLTELDYKPAVIMITAHSEYASRAYENNVADYLLKPVRSERFNTAVNKVVRMFEANFFEFVSNDHFEINKKGEWVNVNTSDILFFQSLANYVQIYTEKEVFIIHSTTAEIEKKLKDKGFTRVHKSYIVNNSFISAVNINHIKIHDYIIPIGKTYVKFIVEKFKSERPD